MKKFSTVQTCKSEIFKEQKLTIRLVPGRSLVVLLRFGSSRQDHLTGLLMEGLSILPQNQPRTWV